MASGDLSGERSAYRGGTIRCPGCSEIMRQEPVPSAEVDVCDGCGGLWIDWFDGDIPTLAAEAEAARAYRESALRTPIPSGSAIHGNGTCPRCLRALAADTFRFPDADPPSDGRAARPRETALRQQTWEELIDHVELLRCAECAGSFVPRASAHLLLERAKEPNRSVSIWAALVELLRRLVAR